MKLNRSWLILISLFLMLSATACSLNRALPAEADEEAMELEVRSAIAAAGKVDGLDVKVSNGVVTLGGNVASEDERRRVGEAAQRVNGVRSVVNNLHVQ